MYDNFSQFDYWIRHQFVDINTALEEIYWQQEDKTLISNAAKPLLEQLEHQGKHFITQLLAEGNTDQGFEHAFDLLGNVGLYMAACRRHEITEPSRETHSPLQQASALAMHIGASIGVIPRFSTAHLTTHNKAVDGVYKRFTTLIDEKVFVDFNTKGILAYKQAADSLLRIKPLGLSHPATAELLKAAVFALQNVHRHNEQLFNTLDTERFFYCVRPYYKPHRVGSLVYRGANAGDFAGINVIDLLTGLCAGNDPSYSQMLVDKFLYMMPEDQTILRDCMRQPNMLDQFMAFAGEQHQPWYQEHLKLFLELCQWHGLTAIQHHNQLVEKYICQPATQLNQSQMATLTASGPPLEVLLNSLSKLRDHRAAAKRDDIATRFNDLETLKATLR